MKPKPPCPLCSDPLWVKTLAGATKGQYRYKCFNHDEPVEWSQVPPHKQSASSSLQIKMKQHAQPRQYRCGICGLIKKGHVCSGIRTRNVAALPAASATTDVLGDDSDEEEPPQPPALLQLRPLSAIKLVQE